jgi:hypothetical protein
MDENLGYRQVEIILHLLIDKLDNHSEEHSFRQQPHNKIHHSMNQAPPDHIFATSNPAHSCFRKNAGIWLSESRRYLSETDIRYCHAESA